MSSRTLRYRGLGAVLGLLAGVGLVVYVVDAVGDLAGFLWRWVILLPSTLGEQSIWFSQIEALATAVWWVFWFAVDVLVIATAIDLVRELRSQARARSTSRAGSVSATSLGAE